MLLGVLQGAVGIAFAVSGVLKLAQPSSGGDALRELGVPRRLLTPLPVALGVAELVMGTLLLVVGGPIVMALAALALIAFTVVLATLHRRAPETSCGCLGDLSSPGGHLRGIARNLCLLALLAVAAVGGADGVEWLAAVAGLELALVLVLATEGLPVLRGLHALGTELMDET